MKKMEETKISLKILGRVFRLIGGRPQARLLQYWPPCNLNGLALSARDEDKKSRVLYQGVRGTSS